MRSSFEAYQESLALTVVWIEHLAGKHSDSTPEEVSEEIRKAHPQSKWAPLPETGSSGPDIWAQLRGCVRELAPLVNAFPKAATLFSWDRIYFDSHLSYVGWVPKHAHEGDQICAFAGSRYPFVIRPCDGGFRLIGACYMHGIMEGEAYELPSMGGDDDDMMITLV